MVKNYLTAKQVEGILQTVREKQDYIGKIERELTRAMVATGKRNSTIPGKVLVCVAPHQIHIPAWQRSLSISAAAEIGRNYDPNKWELPKVLYLEGSGKLVCVDGMHRIYGAFLAKIDAVPVELLLNVTEKEAINLFLAQTNRRKMSPADTYKAGLKAKREDCIRLKEITARYHVAVKGDEDTVKNPVGVLTAVSDGMKLAKNYPVLLDRILETITDLNWASGKYSSKAYSAKVIRSLKALYSKYSGSEALVDEALLSAVKGSEYFATHLALLGQEKLFDTLVETVETELDKQSSKAEHLILNAQ